ncbi:MAG: cysteine desulfurase [Acidobacteria bacterium]|nr:cysteine desulfurase [Acidobacteriota bacterium]
MRGQPLSVNEKRVYLDFVAGAPLPREVFEAMVPYLTRAFGNPQSLHGFGREAREGSERARKQVAELIGASPEEIIFTASGSESNNLALKGAAQAHRHKGNHLVLSQIEHDSVRQPAASLQKQGFEVSFVPVDHQGTLDLEELEKCLTDRTILVSVMHGNNEIGTLQPLKEVSRLTRRRGILLHSDAVASTGNIPVDVDELGVDLLSLAANQFYGPPGAAALYMRKGTSILPLLEGGIQEEGHRAGTENVPAIVGMGKAAELARAEMPQRIQRASRARDRIWRGVQERIDHVYLNGHPERRLPNNLSFCVEFVEGEAMTMMMDARGVAISTGSACATRALKTPHVLQAIGLDPILAQGSLLVTPGKDTTEEEISYFLDNLFEVVERLRAMSPFYPTKAT